MSNYMNKDMIDTFLISSKSSNHDLVVFTSAGTFFGKALDYELLKKIINNPNGEHFDKNQIEYPISALKKLLKDVQKERGREHTSENGIWLKDVSIKYNAVNSISLPLVFIFYDQIVGISLGNEVSDQ